MSSIETAAPIAETVDGDQSWKSATISMPDRVLALMILAGEDDPQAAQELEALGAAAVPGLIEHLAHQDRFVAGSAVTHLINLGSIAREGLVRALSSGQIAPDTALQLLVAYWSITVDDLQTLVGFLRDKDPQISGLAAMAICRIGAPAASAIPELLDAVARNGTTMPDISPALVQVGAGDVAAVARGLLHDNANVRATAAAVLGQLGESAQSVSPQLIASLADRSQEVVCAAAAALGKLKSPVEMVVPALLKLIQGPEDSPLDAAAVAALAEIGETAVPQLLAALKTGNSTPLPTRRRLSPQQDAPQWKPLQRAMAATVLGLLAKREVLPVKEISALATALSDRIPVVRESAAKALSHCGPAAAAAVPALVKQLSDSDSLCRAAACLALQKIGPEARALAQEPLLNLVRTSQRKEVLEALAGIQAEASAAVPVLIAILDEGRGHEIGALLSTLAKVGRNDPGAISQIAARLDSDEPRTRAWALAALSTAGRHAAQAIPKLVELLAWQNEPIQRLAFQTLMQFPDLAAPAVAPLLRTSSGMERYFAAELVRAAAKG